MGKLKLACCVLILLVLTFGLSSFLSLTALAKLYAQSLGLPDFSAGLEALLIHQEISAFIDEQVFIALVTLLAGSLLLLAKIFWGVPWLPRQWSLQNVGWQLLLVNALTHLLAQGLFISNFLAVAPTDQTVVSGLLNLAVEIGTTLVIAALLFVELLILMFKIWQRDGAKNYSPLSSKVWGAHMPTYWRDSAKNHSPLLKVDYTSIRPVIFLYLIGYDLSAAFIPLHMKNLYQPFWGLPEDMVLGLPISGMFISISITIIAAGIWLDKRGWHEPFLTGLILSTCAMLYAWLAPNSIHFIIAMSLAGLGYGLALMASQGFIIAYTDDKTKARGLAYLFAGNFAGSICGTAIGAMLAERIGCNLVFLLGAVIILLSIGYTLIALRGAFKSVSLGSSSTTRSEQAAKQVTAKHYWNFLSNCHVLSLMLFSGLPSAIAVIGLLNYFVPVYLDHLGISQSIIGSVLILYGLCMVYLGPLVSKYIDASNNKRPFVITGGILGSCAFLGFQFVPNEFIATMVTVLLLGLSSCFVLASQTTYALTLDVTKQLGPGRSIGLFRASSRIGQMLGPMLFGWLLVSTDIQQGLTYFGMGYLVAAVLFALVTRARRPAIILETPCYENPK